VTRNGETKSLIEILGESRYTRSFKVVGATMAALSRLTVALYDLRQTKWDLEDDDGVDESGAGFQLNEEFAFLGRLSALVSSSLECRRAHNLSLSSGDFTSFFDELEFSVEEAIPAIERVNLVGSFPEFVARINDVFLLRPTRISEDSNLPSLDAMSLREAVQRLEADPLLGSNPGAIDEGGDRERKASVFTRDGPREGCLKRSFKWAKEKATELLVRTGEACFRVCGLCKTTAPMRDRITSINLTNNNLKDEGARIIAWMADKQRLPRLRQLLMTKNRLQTAGVRALLSVNNKIEVLNLGKNAIKTDMMIEPSVLDALTNSHVRTLVLKDNLLHSQGFEKFTKALLDNKSIRSLDLRENDIGDEGCQVLCTGLLYEPEMEELLLDDNGLTDDGVCMLLDLMSKHGSLNVTTSLGGCRLLTITKYQIAKVQLRLEPILAAVDYVSEPLQLLSYPLSRQKLWTNGFQPAGGTATGPTSAPTVPPSDGSFFSTMKVIFATLMLFIANLRYGYILAPTLLVCWVLIISSIPVGKEREDHLVKWMQRIGYVGQSIILWVISTIASTSLFLPIIDILFRSFLCNGQGKLDYDGHEECWQPGQTIMTVISAVTIPIFIFLSLRAQRAQGDIMKFCVMLSSGNSSMQKYAIWKLSGDEAHTQAHGGDAAGASGTQKTGTSGDVTAIAIADSSAAEGEALEPKKTNRKYKFWSFHVFSLEDTAIVHHMFARYKKSAAEIKSSNDAAAAAQDSVS
jgi:hypothetical protein